jgi:thermostable 8-oxoguanine DNA glycosylase
MNNDLSINLIDGTFAPSEAKKVLLTLLNDKINYHEKEAFSAFERFGVESTQSKNRIIELRNSIQQLKELIEKSTLVDQELIISGIIQINLKNASKSNEVF